MKKIWKRVLASALATALCVGAFMTTNWQTASAAEALAARELIKISVLQNCADDPRTLAEILAERTHSEIVQVIGKKIVLYKENKDNKKIILPE